MVRTAGPAVFWRNGNASGMAYEEASVAGETPDRSKQRKSSGNPTGSEPSVPAQSPEERDPRLAVAREVPAAREDQATAVFSTKAVKDAAASGSKDSGGSGDSAEGAKGAGSGSKGAENGDARLRAAVAAWVATADDEVPEGAEKAPAPGEAAASGDDAPAADEAEASTGSAAEEPADAGGSSGEADADADTDSGKADDADSSGSAADEPADAEGSSGDADGAESASGGSAGANGSSGDVSTDSGEADVADSTDSASGESADAEGSSEKADTDADPDVADAVDSSGGAVGEPAGAEGSSGGVDTSDAADSAADEPAGADGPSGSADAAVADSADGSSGEGDAADSAEDAVPDGADKPAAGEDPSKGADAEDEDASDKADDASEAADDDKAPTGGVDQATAVFKALPPKGKAVDQPTTMLKIGDHKPGAEKPEGKVADKAEAKPEAKPDAKPAAKPEGDAERTSKFVALKPLDSAPPRGGALPPATPAAPAAPATPAAKATTPEKGNVGPERTTQQPLPPRPPLDLLAELTNTPPPPETRVRTTVRRVKVWTPLVLLLVIVFAVVQAVRPLPTPTLTLTAKETVSFEGAKPSMPWPGEGQAAMDVNGIGTFGTSGDQKPVPIASIAKVMTVYLVLRDHPLKPGNNGPNIPVDAAAEKHYETGKAENESVVKVSEGQKIRQYEALQAVMLPSANNIAKLLARWDSKSDSEDEFVAKMNKTAKELGMKNTHYTDPSGLDKTTVSTAEDLVKLGRAAMEDPVFNEISRQPSYKDLNGDKQNNFFGLVPTVAIGIKTGTTTAAGGNILFAAEQKVGGETRTIIGAALGQYGDNGTANIDEVTGVTRKLIEAGQDALKAKKIVKKGDVVGEVDDGLGGTTPVVATKDVTAAGWSGLTVKLKLDDADGQTVPHSAKAGTKVGVLSVGDGKDGAVEVPVALQEDLAEPGFGAKLTRVG
ncbi:D-alanyl-D-alanine carboxypeptidase [Streptomyces sp. NPDC055189]